METTLAIIGWLGAGAVLPAGMLYAQYREGYDLTVSDFAIVAPFALGGPFSLFVGGVIFLGAAIVRALNNPTIIKGRRK